MNGFERIQNLDDLLSYCKSAGQMWREVAEDCEDLRSVSYQKHCEERARIFQGVTEVLERVSNQGGEGE